jgi:hypothetical protein
MLLKIAVILASIPMVLLAMVAGTGLVVVDVKPSDGPHLVLPIPLLLAETAARLAPNASAHMQIDRHLDQVRRFLPAAEEALDALAQSPDGNLVEVDDNDEHVRIGKRGDVLEVRVEGPRENVSVNVPIEVAREAVRQAGSGAVSPGDLIGALRHARLTQLVDVRDGEDRVRITVY